jgi:methylmalonyl-CoA/ethylmalonyl-CoA epimerase
MKIDHVGIAVRSLEAAVKAYEALGLKVSSTDTVASEAVKVAFLPIGETRLELLEPIAPESSIAKSIEKRGEGVHHIALRVENIEESMRLAKERGLQLVNETPRIGAHGRKIAFIHPKSTSGVLLELVQD